MDEGGDGLLPWCMHIDREEGSMGRREKPKAEMMGRERDDGEDNEGEGDEEAKGDDEGREGDDEKERKKLKKENDEMMMMRFVQRRDRVKGRKAGASGRSERIGGQEREA